jgi:hypothetical protein
MSLYNALFGVNPFSGMLLEMLGTTAGDVPRFRDCFLSEDGTEIIIHTRTGGGNRDYYEHPDRYASEYPEYSDDPYKGPWNADLRKLPGFKYDADDDFDCTYADFHFDIPEAFKPQVELLSKLGAISNPAERWQELMTNLRSGDTSTPEVQRALAVGERIFGDIKKAMDGDPA